MNDWLTNQTMVRFFKNDIQPTSETWLRMPWTKIPMMGIRSKIPKNPMITTMINDNQSEVKIKFHQKRNSIGGNTTSGNGIPLIKNRDKNQKSAK